MDKCRICGKKLSIYNHTMECFHHSESPQHIKSHKVTCSSGMCGDDAKNTQLYERGVDYESEDKSEDCFSRLLK